MASLVRLGLVGGVVVSAALVTASQPDETTPRFVRIVTELQTSSASGPPSVMTEYIQSDRRREEFRGFSGTVWITRCDLNLQFLVSPDGHEYSVATLPMMHGGLQTGSPRDPTGRGTVLVEISTVDTGERQLRFGIMARRVLTKHKETPRPGARSMQAEVRTNGWYLDLKPPSTGVGRFGSHSRSDALLNVDLVGEPLDDVVLRHVGTAETGFPIEEQRSFSRQARSRDGAIVDYEFVWSMRVTQLSTEPHDPVLFEVPSGFRRLDVYRPSIYTQLLNTWYWAWDLIRSNLQR